MGGREGGRRKMAKVEGGGIILYQLSDLIAESDPIFSTPRKKQSIPMQRLRLEA